MGKKIKHDIYVEDLCNQIKGNYDSLSTNLVLFSTKKKKRRVIAEIDVLAIKDEMYDVYEVKCSYRITKARKQLRKIKKLLPNVGNMFFFCGGSGVLKEIEAETGR